jgi:urease alpha subunit
MYRTEGPGALRIIRVAGDQPLLTLGETLCVPLDEHLDVPMVCHHYPAILSRFAESRTEGE